MHYVNYLGADGSDNWARFDTLPEARQFVAETRGMRLGARIVPPSRVSADRQAEAGRSYWRRVEALEQA